MAVGAATWEDLLELEQVAHLETVPPVAARTVPLPDSLDPGLRAALPFDELYTHQRAAFEASARGEHLILATGTASGKSLAIQPAGARCDRS